MADRPADAQPPHRVAKPPLAKQSAAAQEHLDQKDREKAQHEQQKIAWDKQQAANRGAHREREATNRLALQGALATPASSTTASSHSLTPPGFPPINAPSDHSAQTERDEDDLGNDNELMDFGEEFDEE